MLPRTGPQRHGFIEVSLVNLSGRRILCGARSALIVSSSAELDLIVSKATFPPEPIAQDIRILADAAMRL
ncbi:hypothetical protein RsS62_31480 [Rhizobium dioscoreae]|nr:hypothetical protein RsS62_31480 [Rhizobium dioscoreae]